MNPNRSHYETALHLLLILTIFSSFSNVQGTEWADCFTNAGTCIDVNAYSCSVQVVQGDCPGGNNILCCPNPGGVSIAPCSTDFSGICKREQDCDSSTVSNQCPGPSNIKCCYEPLPPTAPPTAPPSDTPTASPTAPPSAPPTISPTSSPSASPTASSIESPTASPSAAPTAPPTLPPTSPSSASPTASVTESPTATSTVPSTAPSTASPGSSTSAQVTSLPSASITEHPTASPTVSSTSSDFLPPTTTPNALPSITAPTASPSEPSTAIPEPVPPTTSPNAPLSPPPTSSAEPEPSPLNSPSVSAAPSSSRTSSPTPSPTPAEWQNCANNAGICINADIYECSLNLLTGYCPGGQNIKCCPKPGGVISSQCSNKDGGVCKNVGDCSSSVMSGLCPGPSEVRCCYKRPTPTPSTSPDARSPIEKGFDTIAEQISTGNVNIQDTVQEFGSLLFEGFSDNLSLRCKDEFNGVCKLGPYCRTKIAEGFCDSPGFKCCLPEISKFVSTLVATTQKEYDMYKSKDECDDEILRRRIGDYWDNINKNLAYDGCTKKAWSAVFVSYMMRLAGAKDRFVYNSGHAAYIYDSFNGGRGLYNSAADISKSFPKLGHLACRGRTENYYSWKYSDFLVWSQRKYAFISSHCDIIVDIQGDKITTIGGNLGDQVSKRTLRKSEYVVLLIVEKY